ncbi:O-succinylbenzoic acid--CoA ligase [Vibrio mediterranei AK1]|uniref:o-succinylbenzoate--CoA ligase n=1 Tax=Vibrio mediterranei TaxID=689 RepID=UPI0001541FA0|nr:o-succinylbenzoate--CoA ligase [Vibrio mediterranei]EDL51128.1 O-succinylbenzoic acid--CoA ligase [Vibrio mediterranei AK1]
MVSSHFWEHWAQSAPNDIALITPQRQLTWVDVKQQVDQYRQLLINKAISQGQVVCLIGRAEEALVFAYLACLTHGAVPAIIAVQSSELLEAKLSSLYLEGERAVVWDCSDSTSLPSLHFLSRGTASRQSLVSANVDIASIIFTSGSTGCPKAVVHGREQHIASASGLLERFSFTVGDCWLLSLPMYHVSGLGIVWRWLQAGATLKIASGDFCKDISDVSHASLVSTQLKRIIDNQWQTKLERVLLGGSHIPLSLIQQAKARHIDAWMGYGMTETASTVTAKPVDEWPSSGHILPRRELKLSGNRIFVSGETLAKGYYWQGQILPLTLEGQWLDTRDLGEWVNGNELRVVGRADNLFISGGENVHCEEVEAALNAQPTITQSIVVAVEDEEYGARCVAVVQSTALPTVSEQRQKLADSLPRFKQPIAYFLLPESLSQSGIKVSRAEVKKWLSQHQSNYVVIS